MRKTAALFAAALLPACAAQPPAKPLADFIAADTRTPAYVERDTYRHPQETLAFFGLKPDQTVVEVWPSRGWYTEILAPYLKERGKYYAAGFNTATNPDAPKYMTTINEDFAKKVAEKPELYSGVVTTELGIPDKW